MKNEKIEDLFLIMSMKDDDRAQAEKAFNEFHHRYSNYLNTIIKSATSKFKNSYDIEELANSVFQNTLFTIWEKAETFLKIEEVEQENKEKRIKAWLGKIAQNVMYQLLRDYKVNNEKIIYNTDFVNETNFIVETVEETPPIFEKKLLDSALKSLKERDCYILLTFIEYEEVGKKTPSKVLDDLCIMFDTTKDNLRQIKKRAFDKVNHFIAEQLKIYSYERR